MALDLTPQLRRFSPAPLQVRSWVPVGRSGVDRLRRHWLPIVLITLVVIGSGVGLVHPEPVASASLVPIVVAAGLFLAGMAMYAVFTAAGVALLISSIHLSTPPLTVVAIAVVMLLMIAVERRRSRIGISGEMSTSMLVDLRARQDRQGHTDELPQGWHLDTSIEAAHGAAFSGDFLLAERSHEDVLELVLVDVQGCGLDSGTRSVMLSGAFSGLLGATTPEGFLPAANRYLVRQGWDDGCATAVHLALDLNTGEYSIGSAGHPAALHFRAGCGRWDERTEASGVMLGVLDSELVTYERASGRLERGDALLLYTDGMIESPGCDLRQGMDRMLGVADRVLLGPARQGGAAQICQVALAGECDDRSAVLIRRDA